MFSDFLGHLKKIKAHFAQKNLNLFGGYSRFYEKPQGISYKNEVLVFQGSPPYKVIFDN